MVFENVEQMGRTIGLNIIKYRELLKISQKELALAAHISQSHLSEIENFYGRKMGSLDVLNSIAKQLNIGIEDLIVTDPDTEEKIYGCVRMADYEVNIAAD